MRAVTRRLTHVTPRETRKAPLTSITISSASVRAHMVKSVSGVIDASITVHSDCNGRPLPKVPLRVVALTVCRNL